MRLGKLPDSTLAARRVALLNASLFASPGHLERHGTPEHRSALVGHRRVHLLHQGDQGERRLRHGDGTVEVAGGGAVSANDMAMTRRLARLGVGVAVAVAVAVANEVLARGDVASGALRPVLAGWALAPVPVWVVTPTRLLSAKARIVVDMLAERVSGTVGLQP